jgi:hypothetical protein
MVRWNPGRKGKKKKNCVPLEPNKTFLHSHVPLLSNNASVLKFFRFYRQIFDMFFLGLLDQRNTSGAPTPLSGCEIDGIISSMISHPCQALPDITSVIDIIVIAQQHGSNTCDMFLVWYTYHKGKCLKSVDRSAARDRSFRLSACGLLFRTTTSVGPTCARCCMSLPFLLFSCARCCMSTRVATTFASSCLFLHARLLRTGCTIQLVFQWGGQIVCSLLWSHHDVLLHYYMHQH